MNKLNVLVLGSGGREHSLCEAIRKSPICGKLFALPGNAGTFSIAENISGNPDDFDKIAFEVKDRGIDLVIAGPEDPIVKGIYDFFKSKTDLSSVKVLAPSAQAAQLEGSKYFAKQFMKKYHIPTAGFEMFKADQYQLAREYLMSSKYPVVLKADGLAAGKGVTVAQNQETAFQALDEAFLDKKFGQAGNTLLIEEFLSGIEISVFVLTDGKNYVLLPEAKDYKQVGDGNTGPNTGGMGSVSPVPFFKDDFREKVIKRIIEPTIQGLKAENLDYHGFIFFGLMNVNGNPYVIEYNVRLGDPETESILPRIQSDLLELMVSAANGQLQPEPVLFSPLHSVSVMLVSGGYPGNYEKGKEISGLEQLNDCQVIIAGAAYMDNELKTSGGRVLAVNAMAESLEACLNVVYSNIPSVHFDKMYYRTDIGKDLLNYYK